MRVRCKLKMITAVVFCLIMCILTVPQTAFAYTGIDTQKKTSLTIEYGKEGLAFSDVEIRLYRIADVSEKAEYTLTDEFSGYQVSVNNLDSEGWRALAQTLEAYVAQDKPVSVAEGTTDLEGKLTFSNLETGLYLVIGKPYRTDQYFYPSTSSVISLPNLTESDTWDYHPVITPKCDEPTKIGETADYEAVKIWKGQENEKQRPSKVEIQLLKDGNPYGTAVTLDEENNWRYSWQGLEADHDWKVVEKNVPGGYEVTTVREKTEFTVTNTCKETVSSPGGSSKLPQTGMFWWPVPILAACGMILFLLGWFRRQRSGE